MHRALVASLVLFSSAFVTSSFVSRASAGPLNPPAGPIASTNKTLQEVEPRIAINVINTPGDADSLFKITQPGSYYLTGNITGVAGKHGIEIAASGVTLDLNGFDLAGIPGMGGFAGVRTSIAGLASINVLNGSVRGWGAAGIDLANLPASNGRVEGVNAYGNTSYGILGGSSFVVTNCVAYFNSDDGIVAISGSTITNCVAYSNTGDGIVGNVSTITNCVAFSNTDDGIAGAVSTITNCVAYFNSDDGILATNGSTVTNCSAQFNTSNGISSGTTLTSLTGSNISECTASSNGAAGIQVNEGSRVSGCVLRDNGTFGIVATNDCTISGCTSTSNGLSGIRVDADCQVRDNTCNDNGLTGTGAAGIQTTAANNRVEGNVCSNNQKGFEALTGSTGNLFIRNSASSNVVVNYSFVANNRYGPIVDITGATAAVNGNSAASTMTTTDPHANIRY